MKRFIMSVLGRDDDVIGLFYDNHLTPDISFTTLENFTVMAMVEQVLGMSITNELITRNWKCDVVRLPLGPPQLITLGIGVPSLERATPAVKKFVRYAVDILAQGNLGASYSITQYASVR